MNLASDHHRSRKLARVAPVAATASTVGAMASLFALELLESSADALNCGDPLTHVLDWLQWAMLGCVATAVVLGAIGIFASSRKTRVFSAASALVALCIGAVVLVPMVSATAEPTFGHLGSYGCGTSTA